MLTAQLFTAPPDAGGTLLADWTGMTLPDFSSNGHGFAAATVVIPVGVRESFRWFSQVTGWLVISHQTQTIWEGLAEEFDIDTDGTLTITAYGAYIALSDLPYTALWSSSRTSDWSSIENSALSSRQPGRYTMSQDNQIYIAPSNGEAFDLGAVGSQTFVIPNGSARQILAVSFDYSFTAPNTTWIASLSRFNAAYGFLSTVWSLSGNGATQTGTQTIAVAACDRLVFNLLFNRDATTLGTAIVDLTTSIAAAIALGVRTVTPASMVGISAGMWLTVDDDNIDTAIAAGVGAIGAQVVTPGSMVNIIVGSVLDIDDFSAETVTVTAVAATTFTATYAKTHGAGCTVRRNSPANEVVYVTATAATTFTATFVANHVAASRVRRAPLRRVKAASMTGIVRGGRLAIGGTTPEIVEVLEVTANSFVAEFTSPHASTDTVSWVWDGETDDINLKITNIRLKTTASATVGADEIIKALVTETTATNTGILSSSTALIQAPGVDLFNETYLDMYPADIIEYLLTYGDTAGNVWECAVWEGRRVQYQERGSRGRTWYFDPTPAVSRRLDRLMNSAYAVYTDAEGREVRSSTSTNATSVARFGGRTRRQAIPVDTTSATQATASRDVALGDSLTVGSVGDIPIDAIYDVVGNWWPPYFARAGDIFVARTLPVGVSASVDATRAFRSAAVAYSGSNPAQPLTVAAELRAPRFAAYEVQRANKR